MDVFNLVAVVVITSVLVLYNVIIVVFTKRDNEVGSLLNTLLHVGPAFVDKHFAKDDAPTVTLAIQSLRNVILVSIFIGGLSFQYAISMLVNASTNPVYDEQVRGVILATFLLSSFLNFALCIRCSSHLGLIIDSGGYTIKRISNIKTEEEENIAVSEIKKQSVLLVKRMSLHFSLGFRCLYVAIPYAYYALGPIGLVVAGVLIFIFLLYVDFGFSTMPTKGYKFREA
jgi:Protein of unknown function, DUF599